VPTFSEACNLFLPICYSTFLIESVSTLYTVPTYHVSKCVKSVTHTAILKISILFSPFEFVLEIIKLVTS
jgi:hypothetical protein